MQADDTFGWLASGMDISSLMRTLGAKASSFRMHRPADEGVPGGLIVVSLELEGGTLR